MNPLTCLLSMRSFWYNLSIVGKQSCTSCCPLHSWVRMCLGPRRFSYGGVKSWSYLCIWEYLYLFWVWHVLLCSAYASVSRGTRTTPLLQSRAGKEWGPLPAAQEVHIQPIPLRPLCHGARLTGHREPTSHYWSDLALPPPCVSKALFHLVVSVWVTPFLVTLTPINHTVGRHLGTASPGTILPFAILH